MASSREIFKKILFKEVVIPAGASIQTSIPINVQGREKVTFYVVTEGGTADMTINWSWDGATKWYPLAGAIGVTTTDGVVKRITIDDIMTYSRLKLDNFSVLPLTISAWVVAL